MLFCTFALSPDASPNKIRISIVTSMSLLVGRRKITTSSAYSEIRCFSDREERGCIIPSSEVSSSTSTFFRRTTSNQPEYFVFLGEQVPTNLVNNLAVRSLQCAAMLSSIAAAVRRIRSSLLRSGAGIVRGGGNGGSALQLIRCSY